MANFYTSGAANWRIEGPKLKVRRAERSRPIYRNFAILILIGFAFEAYLSSLGSFVHYIDEKHLFRRL